MYAYIYIYIIYNVTNTCICICICIILYNSSQKCSLVAVLFVIRIDNNTVQKVKWSNEPLGAKKLIEP
jgi:hypothetical protein